MASLLAHEIPCEDAFGPGARFGVTMEQMMQRTVSQRRPACERSPPRYLRPGDRLAGFEWDSPAILDRGGFPRAIAIMASCVGSVCM